MTILKHKYINKNKVFDFSKKITEYSIYKDLRKYNIQNVRDLDCDETWHFIATVLWDDYDLGRANYKAYIEQDMDLRMLMELRKSAVLRVDKTLDSVYAEYPYAETPQDVKAIRTKMIKKINADYNDEDWQYMAVAISCLGKASKYFACDFEDCYEDGDREYQVKERKDYIRECLMAHFQGWHDMDFSNYGKDLD